MPRQEIERLYEVFSRYPCPKHLEGCPCCTSAEAGELLVRTPLRRIPAPDLEHYAFKALSTWGTLDDYKYFIPRILELTEDGSLLCDTEITLGKLPYGNFRDWPSDEQEAIRDVITAVWLEKVRASDLDGADALLCGAARVFDDISWLLDAADTVAPSFKGEYAAECSNQTKRKLLNSFWDRSTPNYERVLSWLYPGTTIS